MTVKLALSSEAESRLREQAAAAGKDLASFVLEAVEEKLAVATDASSDNGHEELSKDQWITRFRRWAASHRALPYEADDSRDSIYAGRGE